MRLLVQPEDIRSLSLEAHHLRRIERSLPALYDYAKRHERPPTRTKERRLLDQIKGQVGEVGAYLWWGGELGFQEYCKRRDILDKNDNAHYGDRGVDITIRGISIDVKSVQVSNWSYEHLTLAEHYWLTVYNSDLAKNMVDIYLLAHVEFAVHSDWKIAWARAHLIGYAPSRIVACKSHKEEHISRLSPLHLKPVDDLLDYWSHW